MKSMADRRGLCGGQCSNSGCVSWMCDGTRSRSHVRASRDCGSEERSPVRRFLFCTTQWPKWVKVSKRQRGRCVRFNDRLCGA